MQNAAKVMYLNKHACSLCVHLEKKIKLETTSSQKTSCQTHIFVCLTASFLATGSFIKLFHKIPGFLHDHSVFFKFHDFSMNGFFFS